MASNETSHRIRPVEAGNVADLIRIGEETNLSPWTAQHYLDEIKDPNAIMLRVVAEDNSTLGFVVGRRVTGGSIDTTLDAEIYNIAVNKERQGSGFGQELFDAFANLCRQSGVGNIWLEVRESNKQAIGFYKRNGFEQVQTRNNFYSDPREHALLMRLILK
ncbi:MAG: ribosomal protein S18-alanine N-acetyltransferase [Pyrinomonadaceae bacterium]